MLKILFQVATLSNRVTDCHHYVGTHQFHLQRSQSLRRWRQYIPSKQWQ